MTKKETKTRAGHLAVLASAKVGEFFAQFVPILGHLPFIDSALFGVIAVKYGPPVLLRSRDRYAGWLKGRSAISIAVIITSVVVAEVFVSLSWFMDTGMLLFDEITFVWLVVPAVAELWGRATARFHNIRERLKPYFGR